MVVRTIAHPSSVTSTVIHAGHIVFKARSGIAGFAGGHFTKTGDTAFDVTIARSGGQADFISAAITAGIAGSALQTSFRGTTIHGRSQAAHTLVAIAAVGVCCTVLRTGGVHADIRITSDVGLDGI